MIAATAAREGARCRVADHEEAKKFAKAALKEDGEANGDANGHSGEEARMQGLRISFG